MNKTIKIHQIETKPGEKKCGFLKIGEMSTGLLEMPIIIINGNNEGPTLCLTAGIHACEYAGIAAVIKVLKKIKPEELSGSIIGVPVINMSCFVNRRPYLVGPVPFGSEYLAMRSGKPDPYGVLGERLRHIITNDVISKSNMHIDCHGGDFDENLVPNTYFSEIGEKKHDETSMILSRIYGLKYLIPQKESPDELIQKNIPNIRAECGGFKTLLPVDVMQHINGINNVMKFYNMIEGIPRIRSQQLIVNNLSMVKAVRGGLFYPKIDIGNSVKKGQVVGEIWNIWGDIIEKLVSPCDGIVRKMFNNHATNTGEPLIQIMDSPELAPSFPPTDKYIDLDFF